MLQYKHTRNKIQHTTTRYNIQARFPDFPDFQISRFPDFSARSQNPNRRIETRSASNLRRWNIVRQFSVFGRNGTLSRTLFPSQVSETISVTLENKVVHFLDTTNRISGGTTLTLKLVSANFRSLK